MIYFQQSITVSSDITASLRITPYIIHQLLNNTLHVTGKDSLNYLFRETNHSFLRKLKNKLVSYEEEYY